MATASGFDLESMDRLRIQRRWAVFWVLGGLPFSLALFYGGAAIGTGLLLMLAWTACGVLSLGRLRLFDCPRCSQLFYASSHWGTTSMHIPFGGQCMHCGFDLDSGDLEPIV